MHVFLHFGTFGLMVLQLILASKLSELEQFEKFSSSFNSLHFEAKINCNTFRPNVPKWRKTCAGLKYDLLHFYGPQSHILSGDTFEGPCTSLIFIRCILYRYHHNIYRVSQKKVGSQKVCILL